MATSQQPKDMTWQQKLEKGLPLNTLEEVKADADFNYRTRLRDEEERKAFEKLKSAGREVPQVQQPVEPVADVPQDADQDGKKGK